MKKNQILLFSVLALLIVILSSCSGHPYFNTWFNLNRHYEQGLRDLKIRKDTASLDTAWLSSGEREHWQKVLEKGEKIQKQWPNRKDYAPKVLFRMGMAQLRLAQWNECLRNFEELERNYADFDSVPAAQFHRATCLDKKGDRSLARFALSEIAQNPRHPYYSLALVQLAKLEGSDGHDSLSLAALEKLLGTPGEPSILRGNAHFQAARIYDRMSKWSPALGHYRDSSVGLLPLKIQYTARLRSAILVSYLGDTLGGIRSLESLAVHPKFQDSLYNTQFVLAQWLFEGRFFDRGEKILMEIARKRSHTEEAAHAWYLLGERERTQTLFLDKALQYYDSSNYSQPRSEWAGLSRQRAAGIRTILASRKSGYKDAQVNFQASEAYLFQLDQADSSLVLLKKISDDTTAQLDLRMKALYAQAYLRETAKSDSASSDSLLRSLIQKYPGTDYAKQAQRNLGQEVTQLTYQDSAHLLFLKAESLQVVDSKSALPVLDSIILKFPKSSEAPRALWVKANLLGSEPATKELARQVLLKLQKDYLGSNYADVARLSLEAKAELDPMQLRTEKELLQSLERNLQYIREQSAREEKLREQMQANPAKTNAEEELLWDYNERYDP